MEGHPPRTASHHPRGTQPPAGHASLRTVLGPHARAAVRTARGQQTTALRREDGQPEADERLTSDASHNGARRPPARRPPPATPTAHDAGWLARAYADAVGPGPHRLCPGHTGNGSRLPALRDLRPGEGCPSQRWKATPPGQPPTTLRGTRPPAGHARQRDSAGPPLPHTRAHGTLAADPDSPP